MREALALQGGEEVRSGELGTAITSRKLKEVGMATRTLAVSLLVLLVLSLLANVVSEVFSLCQAVGNPGHCREVRLMTAGVVSDGVSVVGLPLDLYVAVASGRGLVFIQAGLSADEYFTLFTSAAVLIAAAAIGVNPSSYSYYIYLDPPTVRAVGPSSSAAVGLGTALAILNTTLPEPVAVLGILLPDGGFGYVGYADEKVRSLVGRVRSVLVPRFQNLSRETLRLCEKQGVSVVEVDDLYEALQLLGGFKVVGAGGGDWSYLEQLLGEWVRLVNESLGRYLEDLRGTCRGLGYPETVISVRSRWASVLTHLLTVVRSTWTCGLETGAISFSDIVAKVRSKITRLSEEYWGWSSSLPTTAEVLVVLSEVYATLVRAEELFGKVVNGSVSTVEAVDDLALGYTLAESALALLRALRASANVVRSEHVVDLSRLLLLYRYVGSLYSLLRSSPTVVGRVEELEFVGNLLAKAGELLVRDPAATLALCITSLVKLTKLLYLGQYRGSWRAVEAVRSRVARILNTSTNPMLELYVGLGNTWTALRADPGEVLEAYLGVSVRSFAYTSLTGSLSESIRVPSTLLWYLLAVLPLALGLPLALLLRRARGFSARRTSHSYLRILPPHRSRGFRILRTTHPVPPLVLPVLVGLPHP
jgi:predicted S18 family serine protease